MTSIIASDKPVKNTLSSGKLLTLLILASVAAPLSLNKAAPILPLLMTDLHIGETGAGMLISIFSLVGVVLAIPGGHLIRRIGPRRAGLLALASLAAGSASGALADGFFLLLSTRILEGFGMALMAITGPVLIATRIPKKRRGFAMGLFAANMGIGQVLAFNAAPALAAVTGRSGVWWACAGYSLVFLLFWFFLMPGDDAQIDEVPANEVSETNRLGNKAADIEKSDDTAVDQLHEKQKVPGIARNRSIRHLTLSICLYVLFYGSIQTFLPTYLSHERGMNLTAAAGVASICCFMGIVMSLVTGILCDKTGKRRLFGGVGLVVGAGLILLIPVTPVGWFILLAAVFGMFPPMLPVAAYAAAPEVLADPSENSMALSLFILGQNAGLVIGPILFGALVQLAGWTTTFHLMIPLALLSAAFILTDRRIR